MNAILLFLARIAAALGFARRMYHVDSGTALHVRGETADAATGAPLDAVEISIEQPPEGHERGPQLHRAGLSDPGGRIDDTTVVRWSYDVPQPGPQPAPPLAAVFRKTDFRERRVPFDLSGLPVVQGVSELDVGRVDMTHV